MLFRISLFLVLLFHSSLFSAQEICDNGIDDDFDGMIDLNDDDCFCELRIPESLIPNPSFEDTICCPKEDARLDCAADWIQASATTTDYVHTCGNYLGCTMNMAVAPLPFPHGEGGVGFRDGQEYEQPNYKEYVGACLKRPMVKGNLYRLDFYVGFRDNIAASMDLEIAFFGSTDCAALPFGNTSTTIGCPANTGLYDELGKTYVDGSNEWVNVIFEFIADKPYEVLILGPACEINPNYFLNPYFFLDRLAFEESSLFGEPYQEIKGSICENGLTLSVEYNPQYSYQWYVNGIALQGETGSSIHLNGWDHQEGIYQVRIISPSGCFLSKEYNLYIPPYYETLFDTICSNEIYLFGTEEINTTGYYERSLRAVDGCDSIIQLNLEVKSISEKILIDSICKGEVYYFNDHYTDEEGIYTFTVPNVLGCDSIVQIELTVIPKSTEYDFPSYIEIELGEIIDLGAYYIDPAYTDISWNNNAGNMISALTIDNYVPIISDVIYFNAMDEFGCPVKDSIIIKMPKPDYTLYIPNVFSPNGDHVNDVFELIIPISIDHISRFVIYDRWGKVVCYIENSGIKGQNWGWDGRINGEQALTGVYTYIIEANFIDGHKKSFAGDITLLR